MALDPNKFTRKTQEAIGAAQAPAATRATPRSRPSTCCARCSTSPKAS